MTLPSRCCPLLLVLALGLLLSSCAEPPPPPTAKVEIGDAERSMESARILEKRGQYDDAIADYKRARDAISKGRAKANDSERSRLKSMEDEVRETLVKLEIKKDSRPKPAVAPAKPTAGAPKVEDPAEVKAREAAAKQKKEEENAAAITKKQDDEIARASAGSDKKKPKPDDPDEAAELAAAAKATGGGAKGPAKAGADGEGGGEGEAAVKKEPKKSTGPFPEITEQSPELEVVKVFTKGKLAVAHFQIYNKGEAGKRIAQHAVFFKNNNNEPVMTPVQVAVYPFKGFNLEIKDVFSQSVEALTAGSHGIDGMAAMQLVALGETERIAEIKSVLIKLMYDDGKTIMGNAPLGAAPVPATGGGSVIKALKK